MRNYNSHLLSEIAGWGDAHNAKEKALNQLCLMRFGEKTISDCHYGNGKPAYRTVPDDETAQWFARVTSGAIPLGWNNAAAECRQTIRVFLKCIVWNEYVRYAMTGTCDLQLAKRANRAQSDWYDQGPLDNIQKRLGN